MSATVSKNGALSWFGKLLCAIGAHRRKTIARIGDRPFGIIVWRECQRCGVIQRWDGVGYVNCNRKSTMEALAGLGLLKGDAK